MALTTDKFGRYVDGFLPLTDYYEAISLPVGSAVAISRGDCLTISSGYVALETTLAATDLINYIAVGTNTAAEASSNGAVSIECIPCMNFNVRYQVPVTADAVLAQATHVGNAYNLDGSEDGITVASSVTTDCGFLIEAIDISSDATTANTYGYAIGRFIMFAETT